MESREFTGDEARWRAVSMRDRTADGRFYTCVTTTGVYCLASCAGRPLRRHVRFVDSRRQAEDAGFRACKRCRPERLIAGSLAQRIAAIDWAGAEKALDSCGFAHLGRLLGDDEMAALRASYERNELFRSKVEMKNFGFGAGEYKYFADPLPEIVRVLRETLFSPLVPIANRWRAALGGAADIPVDHRAYRARCAAAGQNRPTPLMLSYGPGDYNRLHQDLYGNEIFPIQIAILLSNPGKDFDGGEFALTEQRPRMQSRAHVAHLYSGDALAFCVNDRPVAGLRGVYRAKMRHGVSTIVRGRRMALGVIFHDAV
ncbi:MAG: 2OG-Fe(II) oxygenase [Parvularculaceae bacterium]|nr:2OG-Fe(II) oxygenase [Parvularculaceae bacterium]